MLNKTTLIGNVGGEPDVRYTKAGLKVVSFRLATSESWTDQNGEKSKHTEWHSIVAWRKMADLCETLVKSGMLIYIEGKLQTRCWEDNNKVKHYTTEIIMKELKLLTPKGYVSQKQESAQQPMQQQMQQPMQQYYQQQMPMQQPMQQQMPMSQQPQMVQTMMQQPQQQPVQQHHYQQMQQPIQPQVTQQPEYEPQEPDYSLPQYGDNSTPF